jgi:4a-hydroxytetrahydrobiopterin dehydratase
MADTENDWHIEDESLMRDYAFPDFKAALWFVNRVAELAEERNHHPDILVHGWNKVRLTLSTHDAGGLTEADHALAAAIDAL